MVHTHARVHNRGTIYMTFSNPQVALDTLCTHLGRDTGFYFHAYPRTPYKHWGTLVREMDTEEIEARKALRYH